MLPTPGRDRDSPVLLRIARRATETGDTPGLHFVQYSLSFIAANESQTPQDIILVFRRSSGDFVSECYEMYHSALPRLDDQLHLSGT
jgi:hypothetical protein